MGDLKTLKDIRQSYPTPLEDLRWFIEEKDLKQEAIKHVKNNEKKVISTLRGGIKYNLAVISAQSKWIKHFFNITEKDLK